MTLYEAIYNRKSSRNFKMEKMSVSFFQQLDKFLENITPLYSEIRCHIDVVCALDRNVLVKGMFKVKAPYYIVIRSENGYEAYENAGYIMEQISLYFTSKEIGSCYQGAVELDYKTEEPELNKCIVMAFGYTETIPLREASKALRKNIRQVCTIKNELGREMMGILEAARLAPSAFNRQPWRFVVYKNRIHIFEADRVFEKSSSVKSAIDMGIVQCHLMIAAEEMWIRAELTRLDHISEKDVKHHRYIKSLLLQEN